MANSTMGDRSVTLEWGDGTSSDFHYVWLRDNCACAECKHPDAWERILDNVELDLDVRPKVVSFDDFLKITWEDGHQTSMTADWLRVHQYGRNGRESRRGSPILWTAEIANDPPKISLSEIDADDTGLRRWLTMVRDFGFTIVTGVPNRVGAVVELAERIAHLQETHFGREFQVISKPDPENLAYTAVKLTVPHRCGQPSQPAGSPVSSLSSNSRQKGGESILIDGFEAARRLREATSGNARVCSATVEIPYVFVDDGHDVRSHQRDHHRRR